MGLGVWRGHMVGGIAPQKGAWGPRPSPLASAGHRAASPPSQPFTEKEVIGFAIGSVSSVLYLFSRLPQIRTNVSRGQGAGPWAGPAGSLVPWVKDWHGVRGLRGAGPVHSHCWLG